jgi:acetolactate synthase-1/2/3 large subunit
MPESAEVLKLHEAFAGSLAAHGVDTIFGLMGDGNVDIIDSFVHQNNGHYVAATHEASAILMALGYASVSGKVGIATVTHGPGLTNSASALIEGRKGQIPLILIAGDTPSSDREHVQDVPQRDFVLATGAGFEPVRSAGTAMQDIAVAFRRAVVERRPIVINVPFELMMAPVTAPPVVLKQPERRGVVPESVDIDNAVGIIAASRNPVILVGRGAVHAREALIAFAHRVGGVLATTLKAKDLFAGESNNIGLFGTLSTDASVELIMASDCVLSFGASLTRRTTSEGAFLRGKRLVQSNLEFEEIGKYVQPDAGLVGDPVLVTELITKWLDEAEIESRSFNLDPRLASAAGERPQVRARETRDLDFLEALQTIEEAVPKNRILATDAGRFSGEPRKVFSVERPCLYAQNWNSGAIGFGVPTALGASFADGARPVLLITGDGGFMLGGLAEFHTAIRYGIDLIVVVCNDGAYGSEHDIYQARGKDPALSLFKWPSFADVAASMGGAGLSIRTTDDLMKIGDFVESRRGPILIELMIDPAKMPRRH